MGDLLLLLNQVQTLRNGGVILILVLPDLKQDFYHVLTPLANLAFVQNGSKSFKDGIVCFGRVFGKELTDFTHEPDGNFDRVVSGTIEAQKEYLEGNDFVSDILVTKMSDEGGSGVANSLQDIRIIHTDKEKKYTPYRFFCKLV